MDRFLRFEHYRQAVVPRGKFLRRLGGNLLVGLVAIAISLVIGVVGYRLTEPTITTWLDAYLEASMILAGMGPVNRLTTDAAKFFAGTYALYSGVLLLGVAGLILAPVFHRVLHTFHVESDDEEQTREKKERKGRA